MHEYSTPDGGIRATGYPAGRPATAIVLPCVFSAAHLYQMAPSALQVARLRRLGHRGVPPVSRAAAAGLLATLQTRKGVVGNA